MVVDNVVVLVIQVLTLFSTVSAAVWYLSGRMSTVEVKLDSQTALFKERLKNVTENVSRAENGAADVADRLLKDRTEHDLLWKKVRQIDKDFSVCRTRHGQSLAVEGHRDDF